MAIRLNVGDTILWTPTSGRYEEYVVVDIFNLTSSFEWGRKVRMAQIKNKNSNELVDYPVFASTLKPTSGHPVIIYREGFE